MKTGMARWFGAVGMDFHIATTLLLRVWSIAAGVVMLFAIPATLSQQQQGYYFTFASLLGLQIFFELGLNQVITQLTSKEVAFIGSSDKGDLHLDRMRSIFALLRRWYAVAALLFFLTAFIAGAAVLKRGSTPETGAWVGPWAALAAVTAVNLYYSPMMAVAEGCGLVGQVARLRLIQSILGYGLVWASLFAGLGLWSVPLNALAASICTSIWLQRADHGLDRFQSDLPITAARAIDWRREVLPFQWRIAASWISGYLMYQLFTPLIFLHLGPVVAGRLGMSIAIFVAIQSVGISWISARLPNMSRLIALHIRSELNHLFLATLIGALTIVIVGCICVLAAVAVLDGMGFPLLQRLADLPTLIALAMGTVGNTLVFALASYMRAHGEEPMLPPSIAAAVLTLTGAYAASFQGTFLTMLTQSLVTFGLVIPWTFMLFRRYWKRIS